MKKKHVKVGIKIGGATLVYEKEEVDGRDKELLPVTTSKRKPVDVTKAKRGEVDYYA